MSLPSYSRSAPTCPFLTSCYQVKRDFSDIVLPEQLHSNVRLLASSAANTKRHGAPFRHMLFYGKRGEQEGSFGGLLGGQGRLKGGL